MCKGVLLFTPAGTFRSCAYHRHLSGNEYAGIQFPGRSHYDYCVDYVVRLLEEAEADLPAVVADDDAGRATSTICKALKARVLLTAASPLWNGSFPYKNWKNTNYETPGYGKELVSNQYSAQKWERALTACEEALTLARVMVNANYWILHSQRISVQAKVCLCLSFRDWIQARPKDRNFRNGWY